MNSAPPLYRPDPMYPGLPDPTSRATTTAPAKKPEPDRPEPRKGRPWLVMAPVLTAVIGFGLAAGLITVNRPAVPRPSPAPGPSPVNLLVVTGAGTHETRAFISGRTWTLRYTFACPGAEGFTVTEDRTNKIVEATTTAKGAGSITRHEDPGTHILAVRSACEWTLTAIG